MNTAEEIENSPGNRRTIFRIADPEFANMTVQIQGSKGFVTCTCLDISALGMGVLVSATDFAATQPGMLLEYTITFVTLNPVSGVAIVANVTETSLVDNDVPLLRLGLRFSEAEHSRARTDSGNRRRCARHRLPVAIQPIVICNDPLWLGNMLAIQVLDLSAHGMSGIVSAKQTVLKEGLRTVFRIAFPSGLGVLEIPSRIIYANPIEEEVRYRIGCEFVRRTPEFIETLETYFEMYGISKDSAPGTHSEEHTPGGVKLVSEPKALKSLAEGKVNQEFGPGRLPEDSLTAESIFLKIPSARLSQTHLQIEILQERELNASDDDKEPTHIGDGIGSVRASRLAVLTPQELRAAIEYMSYFIIVRRLSCLEFLEDRPEVESSEKLAGALFRAGLRTTSDPTNPLRLTVTRQDLESGSSTRASLWFSIVSSISRYPFFYRHLQEKASFWPRACMIAALLLKLLKLR